uniref:Uncharacterized protein n=1 Tax=Arundo donax TaxID=35708 RepID=A0A0A9GR12_ARUDO
MNKLELELLGVLDFEVAVGHRAYDRYHEHLEKEMRRENGMAGAAALPKERTAASGKPPVAVAATAAAGEHDRRFPNGVPAKQSLRELWAFDY